MPELVSQSEFARRIGRSRQYVSKLITQGKIVLRDKKVDVVAAKKALKDIEDPQRPKQRKIQKKVSSNKPATKKRVGTTKTLIAPGYKDTSPRIPKLGTSLAKKEFYKAEQERVRTMETAGKLVPAEEVKKTAF